MIALSKALSKFSLLSKNIFNVYTYKEFHSAQEWHRFYTNTSGTTLGLTYLPRKSKFALTRNRTEKRKKKVKKKNENSGPLLIACKRKQFNHYMFNSYDNSDEIPLACENWGKSKSNGDYFSILPTSENPAFIYPSELESLQNSFTSLGLSEEFIQKLKQLGFLYPTYIQFAAIPRIMAGQHVLLCAETGCGKTLAYVLPMLENILRWKPKIKMNYNSPLGVILAPTRELVLQIEKVVKSLLEGSDINCEALLSNYSNHYLLNMKSDSIKYVDIVVSTVGIMCKLTYHKIYSLSNCLNLVFDEADMLLDNSFIGDSRALFRRANFGFNNERSVVPKGTQLSLVSATVPYELHEKLNEVFPSHLLENITTRYLHRTLPHITHKFIRCSKLDRVSKTLDLVKTCIENNEPLILFCNKVKTSNWLGHFLRENGVDFARCNSQMSYENREAELKKFQEGKVKVLTSSDLISRGQNMTQVKHIINFDFPMSVVDYVHRSGRTGRIGVVEQCQNSCYVTSFICNEYEAHLLKEIELSVRRNDTLPHMDSTDSNNTRLSENKNSLNKKVKKRKS